ncbi:MAG TPA: 50S ribosomal protein L15 [Patescibacteria group bacterium]
MMMHEIQPSTPRKSGNRVGRGISAGQGKTAGRGTKGQKSRSGYNIPRKFEGGQTPLILRLPKVRGFKHHRLETQLVDRSLINKHFTDGEVVSPTTLAQKGLIKSLDLPVKVLGSEKVTINVTYEDVKQTKVK